MSIFKRARPRGTRPEIPSAFPGSLIYRGPSQWGTVDLPNPGAATVAGLPAANRAKLLISNAVASMSPMQAWTADGYVADETPTLLTRPNSVYGTFDYVQMAVEQALVHGNHLAIKADFDSAGFPQQIVPVPHGMWFAYYDGDGYAVYSIGGELYSRDEVFHVRANAAPNQIMGIGVVTMFRRAMGAALDQQALGADIYRSGATPAGLIKTPFTEVDPKQATAIGAQWDANHASTKAPAVLPKDWDFVPIQWSPEDMDFLSSREFAVGEMAHMFNMDASDLGAALATGPTQLYANIEQRQTARQVDTYGPWLRRFEEEFTDCIPGGNSAKFVPENMLRTDTRTRAEVDQLRIGNETLTVDEARKSYGMRPLPKPKVVEPDGDEATAPGAPPMPGMTATAGPAGDEVLAGAKAVPDPDDPNISQTPVKVKV